MKRMLLLILAHLFIIASLMFTSTPATSTASPQRHRDVAKLPLTDGPSERLSLVPALAAPAVPMTTVGCQSPCTPLASQRNSWPRDSVVYVNTGTLNTEQRRQVGVGLANWTQANYQAGNNVSFTFGTPPAGAPFLNFTLGSNPPNDLGIVEPAQMRPGSTDAQGNLMSATIVFDLSVQRVNPAGQMTQALDETSSSTIFTRVGQHEVGHTMGFGEAIVDPDHPTSGPCASSGQVPGSTVMNGICGANDWGNNMPAFVTPCDTDRLQQLPQYSGSPSPTPTPSPTPEGLGNAGEENGASQCNDGLDNDGDGLIDCDEGSCNHYCVGGCSQYQQELCVALGAMGCWQGQCYTPLLVDVKGDGFRLTSKADGVVFRALPDFPTQMSWTAAGSDDSWLVLDRNRNGTIDSGLELFGNATPQAGGPDKNGFKALAQYDTIFFGGNTDGRIDKSDAVFAQLRLWRDINHNAISEPDELTTLPSVGIGGIKLDYKESKEVDQHGNAFRYRSKLLNTKGGEAAKWIVDVILVTH